MEGLFGKTLDKTYRIDQLLGQGDMGAVYKARDVALNRDVAVKVMHSRLTDDAEFRARFQREARAIAALHHLGMSRCMPLIKAWGCSTSSWISPLVRPKGPHCKMAP